jgi:hypothetical protein
MFCCGGGGHPGQAYATGSNPFNLILMVYDTDKKQVMFSGGALKIARFDKTDYELQRRAHYIHSQTEHTQIRSTIARWAKGYGVAPWDMGFLSENLLTTNKGKFAILTKLVNASDDFKMPTKAKWMPLEEAASIIYEKYGQAIEKEPVPAEWIPHMVEQAGVSLPMGGIYVAGLRIQFSKILKVAHLENERAMIPVAKLHDCDVKTLEQSGMFTAMKSYINEKEVKQDAKAWETFKDQLSKGIDELGAICGTHEFSMTPQTLLGPIKFSNDTYIVIVFHNKTVTVPFNPSEKKMQAARNLAKIANKPNKLKFSVIHDFNTHHTYYSTGQVSLVAGKDVPVFPTWLVKALRHLTRPKPKVRQRQRKKTLTQREKDTLRRKKELDQKKNQELAEKSTKMSKDKFSLIPQAAMPVVAKLMGPEKADDAIMYSLVEQLALKPGTDIPEDTHKIEDVLGDTFDTMAEVQKGPVILQFFRGGW